MRTILFDIDSLLWSACYNVEDFEEAVHKFDEIIQSTVNDISDVYDVYETLYFGVAKNNYRYRVDPNYKSARKGREVPDYLPELQQYICKQYNVIAPKWEETDDVVVRFHKLLGSQKTIIVSIDKDYNQCEGLIYNYIKKEFKDVSKEQAIYFFYKQMVTGDAGDSVNYLKGYGIKWVAKNMPYGLSEYSYRRIVFKEFKKVYKSKARERYIQQYLLLRLDAFNN